MRGEPFSLADLAIDHVLAQTAGGMQFLLDVTPVNADDVRRAFVDGEWKEPLASYQLAEPYVIYCIYDTAETMDGCAWGIVAQPSGIAQAGRIVVPQGGTIRLPTFWPLMAWPSGLVSL